MMAAVEMAAGGSLHIPPLNGRLLDRAAYVSVFWRREYLRGEFEPNRCPRIKVAAGACDTQNLVPAFPGSEAARMASAHAFTACANLYANLAKPRKGYR